MTMKKLVSLGDLARELGVNKSKLAFYVKLGLLVPVDSTGRMNIYEYDNAMKQIKKITELQKSKSLSLANIKQQTIK